MIDFDFFDNRELEELFVATPEDDTPRHPWEAIRRSLCGAEEPTVVWERMLQGSSLASTPAANDTLELEDQDTVPESQDFAAQFDGRARPKVQPSALWRWWLSIGSIGTPQDSRQECENQQEAAGKDAAPAQEHMNATEMLRRDAAALSLDDELEAAPKGVQSTGCSSAPQIALPSVEGSAAS
mmetsp:Transcript_32676/g.74684  ORF Transcript_32676/g.74684 Transcript_32676/m.74684 type:complete len:183 (-) Transcript_32676:45-593(-)